MERKERRTFFCHIYIAAVGIIFSPKPRESVRMWRGAWKFFSFSLAGAYTSDSPKAVMRFLPVTESVTQCQCVLKHNSANKLHPHPVPADSKHQQSGTKEWSILRGESKIECSKKICARLFFLKWVICSFHERTECSVCPREQSHRAKQETRGQKQTKVYDWFGLNQVSFLAFCK